MTNAQHTPGPLSATKAITEIMGGIKRYMPNSDHKWSLRVAGHVLARLVAIGLPISDDVKRGFLEDRLEADTSKYPDDIRRCVAGLKVGICNVERDGHLNAARHMREAIAQMTYLFDCIEALAAEADLLGEALEALRTVEAELADQPTMRALSASGAERATAKKQAALAAVRALLTKAGKDGQ